MKARILITIVLGVLFGMFLSIMPVQADFDHAVIEDNYSVPDVVEAFNGLTAQGDWLAFYMNTYYLPEFGVFDPESLVPGEFKSHIQGMARSPRTGPPVFYVSVSANNDSPELEFYDEHTKPGLLVIEMRTGPEYGERARSNRLQKGDDTHRTAPVSLEDQVFSFLDFKESHHPSGMGMVGDILAVPLGGGKSNPKPCPEGDRCAGIDLLNYYSADSKGRLVSPEIVLPEPADTAEISLRFREFVAYAKDANGEAIDKGEVMLRAQNMAGEWSEWLDIGNAGGENRENTVADDDQDEVINSMDLCANTTADETGNVDNRGCSPGQEYDDQDSEDDDNDAVPNYADFCPNTLPAEADNANAENFGCSPASEYSVWAFQKIDLLSFDWGEDFARFVGQKIQVSFKHTADEETPLPPANTGWYVDDIKLVLPAEVPDSYLLSYGFEEDDGENDCGGDCWDGWKAEYGLWDAGPLGGRIVFYDCSDPLFPEKLPYELMINHGAQGVGITQLPETVLDGVVTPARFLLVTNDGAGAHFHWSNKDSFGSEGFKFDKYKKILANTKNDPLKLVEDGFWPIKSEVPIIGSVGCAFQSVSLVNEIDEHGAHSVFLVGSCNSNTWSPVVGFEGMNVLYLLEVEGADDPENITLVGKEKESEKNLKSYSDDLIAHYYIEDSSYCGAVYQVCKYKTIAENLTCLLACSIDSDSVECQACLQPCREYRDFCEDVSFGYKFIDRRWHGNFNAGGSTYVSPSGELLYYGVHHFADGIDHTVKIAELRNIDVMRDGSPTKEMLSDPGGPYAVDEGNSVMLDGSMSRPAIAAPWVNLFEHSWFAGQSVMIDYADRNLDDYNNFTGLDGQPLLSGEVDLMDSLAQLITTISNFTGTMEDLDENDFLSEVCIGTYAEGNTCYVTPPFPGGEQACLDFFEQEYRFFKYGICGWACGVDPPLYTPCDICKKPYQDIRDAKQDLFCGDYLDGLEGEWGWVPDYSRPGWITTLTAIGTTIPGFIKSADTLLESIKLSGRLLNASAPEPPPMPPNPFAALTEVNWSELTDFDSLDPEEFVTQLGDIVSEYAACATAIGKALVDLPAYLTELTDYLDDLRVSLLGFNNQASSVKWYAPAGMDIILYEKAGYEGESLALPGTGDVEEYGNLGTLQNLPDWNDRVRSAEFNFSFTPQSALTGYEWSIVYPTPPEPYSLLGALTVTPTFDATVGDGPSSADVELEVEGGVGQVAQATAIVQVFNLAPAVEIDRIEDQTGTRISDFAPPVLLEAVEYVLFGNFTDPGVLDWHFADIDWGDNSPTNITGDGLLQMYDSTGGVTGLVYAPHAYAAKGLYSITLTVEDKDGDSSQASREIQVVDALEATLLSIDYLTTLLDDPALDENAADSIGKALTMLQGNQDGVATNGVLYFLSTGELNDALEKIKLAMIYLNKAVEIDPSLVNIVKPVQRLMTTAAKSVASKAVLKAEAMAQSINDQRKITKAYDFLAEGDILQIAGDFVGAAQSYKDAYKAVQGII